MSKYVDKMANLSVLGLLIKEPTILENVDKYPISAEDFPDKIYSAIFLAINNLFVNGMRKIDVQDIVLYIKSALPKIYEKEFEKTENGLDILNRAVQVSDIKKLDYYYNRMKKFTLLRTYDSFGVNVESLYNPNTIDFSLKQKQEAFLENCNIIEIADYFDDRIEEIKSKALLSGKEKAKKAGMGIVKLIDDLQEHPAIGAPLPFGIYNSIVNGARLKKVYLCSAETGFGKAIPNSTIIPTLDGDRKVGDIVVGDYLFDRLGKPTKVLGVYPNGLKDSYEITFEDGRKARCNDEHLWSYYYDSHDCKKIRTETLREIIDRVGEDPQKNNGSYKIKIPINEAVGFLENKFEIDPYVFGLFIGDGSFREQESSKSLGFSSKDIEIVKNICEIQNWEYKKSSAYNYTYTFYKLSEGKESKIYVSDFLKNEMNLYNKYSYEKYIPTEYLHGSIEQRFSLLQGLMDTDGTVDIKGRVSFCTTSKQLVEDFIYLVRSLGFSTRVAKDPREGKYTKECFVVHLTAPYETKLRAFKLKRKRDRIINKLNDGKRRETKNSIAIVKIEKLNIQEEMTCFYVDNEEHLFLMNDFIVTHNTRNMVSSVCYLSCSEIFNLKTKQWDKLPTRQPSLYIATEQELEEVQTMMLAFISGVNEAKILNVSPSNKMTPEERARVDRAARIIEEAPLWVVELPDFSLSDIENAIKGNIRDFGIMYVALDYIHTSLKILEEISKKTNGIRLREDNILFMLAIKLKDIANQYGVFIITGTQLNGSGEAGAAIANAGMLRGARAIGDKMDYGEIMRALHKEDLDALEIIKKTLTLQEEPNMIRDIFKNRRSQFQKGGKLWCRADFGTCRIEPLFFTDSHYNIIPVDEFNIVVDEND